ncbi:unnamed protein product [Linum tenue]|uniref:Uncharacterized protein n=1 Tax=Linum tenue TaxID=586396 RepID=A0AAV0M5Z6_9ROSI|nr:unnamed protein product [Linum tenue]
MWRFAWKHVPALHFRSDSFEQHSSFQEVCGESFISPPSL